jgi:hypothetical protein
VLPRRIYTQLKSQDWTAATIELLIVVVGIFLGLQASNWNDNRVERNLERGYLIRLQEDILASARGQERDIDHLEQQLSDQKVILAALDECRFSSDDLLAIQRGIGSLGLVNAPRLFRRTIDDLAATGRMDIIQNEEIKTELAAIVAAVEFRGRVMESVFRHVEHHRHFIDDQVRYDVSQPINGPPWSVAVEFDIQNLCNEPRNIAAISSISFYTRDRLMAFRQLLERYQTFLPLLEHELNSRWGRSVSGAQSD